MVFFEGETINMLLKGLTALVAGLMTGCLIKMYFNSRYEHELNQHQISQIETAIKYYKKHSTNDPNSSYQITWTSHQTGRPESRWRKSPKRHDTPPKNGQFLARLVTPPKHQEEILGDLEEMYHKAAALHGVRKASFLYYWHVGWSIPPTVKAAVLGIILKLLRRRYGN